MYFADMARTNMVKSSMPPRKWEWRLLINEGFVASDKKGKEAPPKGGKGKGKAPRGER